MKWYCKVNDYYSHREDNSNDKKYKLCRVGSSDMYRIHLTNISMPYEEFCKKYGAGDLTFNTIENLLNWLDNIDWRSL